MDNQSFAHTEETKAHTTGTEHAVGQGQGPAVTENEFPGAPKAPAAAPEASGTSNAPLVLAIVALVTGVMGIFPVSIVLAIVALVMNSRQRTDGSGGYRTSVTAMSIVSIVLSVIMAIVLVFAGVFVWRIVDRALSGDLPNATVTIGGEASHSSDESASKSEAKAPGAAGHDIVGTWKFASIDTDEDESGIAKAAVETLVDMGLDVRLTVKGGGAAEFREESTDVTQVCTWTWEDADAGEFELTSNGRFSEDIGVGVLLSSGTYDGSVDGDELTLENEGTVIVFTRM